MGLEGKAKQRASILGESRLIVAPNARQISDMPISSLSWVVGETSLQEKSTGRASVVAESRPPPPPLSWMPKPTLGATWEPELGERCPLSGTHQAVLGLQLNLQRVDRASQINDIRLVGLKLLRARGHLLVELLHLQWERQERLGAPSQGRWEAGPPARGPPAC